MKARNTLLTVAIVLLTVLNVTVGLAAHNGLWAWDYTLYIYWGETMAVGLLALFLYAKHLLVFFLILILMSYMIGLKNITFMGDLKIPMTFWALYSLFWLVYFEIRRSFLGHRIRQRHPAYQLLYYFAFMSFAIAGSTLLTASIYYGRPFVPAMQGNLLEECLALAIGIPTLTISILKIIDMIGEQHVFYFLLGTYHQPTEKKKIVMFIDMVGSSAAAEKLSPKKGMEMVARFIFDASHSFRVNGGDIVNYTGDGLMVLWPVFQSDRLLKAIDMLNARLEKNRAAYEKAFGFVPDFRIGAHSGSVVISQIGEDKLFLGVYGDVVNTASRIEAMNKETGTKVLLSRAVKQHVSLSLQKRIRPMGMTEVRGREESVEIFAFN